MSEPAAPIDGRYRLGAVLGTGGSGVVRLAHDERLGRDVAVKLFHPGNADPQRQDAELTLMASLNHPALVCMYDGGRFTDANGAVASYLVMEYVPGQSLHQGIGGGPMPAARVCAVGADLAAALAYLHARGIVHRDVKPANVLLPPEGEVGGEVAAKLSDFGVARLLDGPRATATGMTVGTANYLSPEQVRGEAVGPPSDIYSLALVLLEMLTGRLVNAGTGVEAAVARLNRAPEIPGWLDPGWTALLAEMLDPEPAGRPGASQVRDHLASLAVDPAAAATAVLPAAEPARTALIPLDPSPATAGTFGNRRRVSPFAVLAAVAVGLVVLAGVLAIVLGSGDGAQAPTRTGASTGGTRSGVAQSAATTPAPTGYTPSGSRASASVLDRRGATASHSAGPAGSGPGQGQPASPGRPGQGGGNQGPGNQGPGHGKGP